MEGCLARRTQPFIRPQFTRLPHLTRGSSSILRVFYSILASHLSAMDWSCFTTKADFSFNVKLFNCFSFKRCFTTVFKSSKSKRLTAKQKNFFSCRHYSLSTEASIFPASAFVYNYRLPHPFPSFFQNPASNFGA